LAGALAGGLRCGCAEPTVVPRTDDVVGVRGGAAGGLAVVVRGAVVAAEVVVGAVPAGGAPVVELLPTPVWAGSSRAETRAATSGPFDVSCRTAKVPITAPARVRAAASGKRLRQRSLSAAPTGRVSIRSATASAETGAAGTGIGVAGSAAAAGRRFAS